MRARIDRLGAEARDALGAAQRLCHRDDPGPLRPRRVPGGRPAGAAGLWSGARLSARRASSCCATCRRRRRSSRSSTGLGGLAVAVVGAWLAADGSSPATTLPLLILLALASFLPISEIAQVSRQLADTIASTRRLLRRARASSRRCVDGPLRPPAPVGGSAIRFEGVELCLSRRAAAGARRRRARRSRPARRWRWSAPRAPARRRSPICCCASGTRRTGAS